MGEPVANPKGPPLLLLPSKSGMTIKQKVVGGWAKNNEQAAKHRGIGEGADRKMPAGGQEKG
jgi:hypothetical protein